MTTYELASLHAQLAETINAQLANWLAILSVYLGAGYLVAHRLALTSAIAMSVVAVGVLGAFARVIAQTLVSFVGVSAEIQKTALQSGALAWHQATKMSAFWFEWFPTISMISMFVVIAAAVYFFFSSRHENRKSAPPAAQNASAGPATD